MGPPWLSYPDAVVGETEDGRADERLEDVTPVQEVTAELSEFSVPFSGGCGFMKDLRSDWVFGVTQLVGGGVAGVVGRRLETDGMVFYFHLLSLD